MFFQCWQVCISLPNVTKGRRTCPCCQVTLSPGGTLGEPSEEWLMRSRVDGSWDTKQPSSGRAQRPHCLPLSVCLWSRGWDHARGLAALRRKGRIWPCGFRPFTPLQVLRLSLLRDRPRDDIRPRPVSSTLVERRR